MANDRGLEGPADPRHVEVPDGVTPEEAKAGELARQHVAEHLNHRRVLNMDEMAELLDARPRLEKDFKLPGDSRTKNRVYFFSIDGTLRGQHLCGCLFAGQCMLVQAEGFEKALNLAKDGLRDTIDMALQYWREDNGRLVVASPADAIKVEVGGGRHHDIPTQPDLATDPKLKAMLANLIAGKPWKW